MKNRMKKIICGLIFFFLLTFDVHAAKISQVVVSGDKEKKIGEEGSFQIDVQFSGITKGWDQTLGVWMVDIELKTDDSIKLTGVSTPDFVSILTYDENEQKYYILSEVSDNANKDNLCAGGNLYCGNYTAKVNYVVKDTKKTNTVVDVIELEASLLDITENREYTLDDVILLPFPTVQKYKLSIKQPVSNKNSNSTVVKPSPTKSENKFLKSLEIENYPIEFDKQQTEYTITVDDDLKKLNIKAIPEDKKATYKIIGADNLVASKNIVRVEVTAEDKAKQTYYIRVKYNKKEKEPIIEKDSQENEEKPKEEEPVNSNILKWIAIGAGIFVGIVLIIFIISKINDRSIDKKLKSLEDD